MLIARRGGLWGFLAERETLPGGTGGGPDRRSVFDVPCPVNTMLFDLKSGDQAVDVRRRTSVGKDASDGSLTNA